MKVVVPSTAHDAKGLMLSAIRDPNPVIFMFHKALQGMGWLGTVPGSITDVPEGDYTVPIGPARIAREGADITLVGLGATVHQALEAAGKLAADRVSAEVIDLRSLVPLDREAIRTSVRKTGRLIVIDDDYHSFGVSGEVIATAAEDPAIRWKAAPQRIAFPDIPVPFAPEMEHAVLPNADKILARARELLA